MMRQFTYKAILSLSLVVTDCGLSETIPVWCYTRKLGEFRCFSEQALCEQERRMVWNQYIVMRWGNPLPCQEY